MDKETSSKLFVAVFLSILSILYFVTYRDPTSNPVSRFVAKWFFHPRLNTLKSVDTRTQILIVAVTFALIAALFLIDLIVN